MQKYRAEAGRDGLVDLASLQQDFELSGSVCALSVVLISWREVGERSREE